MKTVEQVISEIFQNYWRRYPDYVIRAERDRHVFLLSTILLGVGSKAVICDIGGGWGGLAAACAAMGMKSILLEDFGDSGFLINDDPRHHLASDYGVTALRRDVIEEGIDFPPASIDAIICQDVIEHLHHSPKRLFSQVMQALRPGGIFFLGAPNCVNIRKRITMLLGSGNWSSMAEWYECPRFRGHVREPSICDLMYIADDIGLVDVRIFGRNWVGYESPSRLVRGLTPLVDRVLRLRPTLCGDIYILGRKPLP